MSSIGQCANIKGALLKYNHMTVRSKIKLTKKYLKCHFKMIIRQPSICCIVWFLPFFSKTVFNLTLLYFSRQFAPVAYARIKKEVCPEPFTLGMTHAKLLALVGYSWCTISTFNLLSIVIYAFLSASSNTCEPLKKHFTSAC